MKHIILAGDSIFDNSAYISNIEPDVAAQVKSTMGKNDKVTLLAVDGDVTSGVKRQLEKLPEDATHLIISVGGNDALGVLHELTKPANNIGEGFYKFYDMRSQFEHKYSSMLNSAMSHGIPTTVCTVYDPCFNHGNLQRVEDYMWYGISADKMQKTTVTALPIFNDIITRQAVTSGVPLMDLRLIFNNDGDYANPIEPSAAGGVKMASVIKKIVNNHRFEENRTSFYGINDVYSS